MVKKKKIKENKKPLQNLEKVIDKVKDSRLKDDVKTLIKTDNESSSRWVTSFPFQVRESPGPSFPEVEEERPVKRPVVLERVVALESQDRKEEKKEIKYEAQDNKYNETKNNDFIKYSGNLDYNKLERFSKEYNEQAVKLDTRSKEHREASISSNREERLGEITLLSDLESRQTKRDVLSHDLIGEDLTRKDYKLGRKSSISKGEYVKDYE